MVSTARQHNTVSQNPAVTVRLTGNAARTRRSQRQHNTWDAAAAADGGTATAAAAAAAAARARRRRQSGPGGSGGSEAGRRPAGWDSGKNGERDSVTGLYMVYFRQWSNFE